MEKQINTCNKDFRILIEEKYIINIDKRKKHSEFKYEENNSHSEYDGYV